MTKYYLIKCETAFAGEVGYWLYATDNIDQLHEFAASCANANAQEWYDADSLADNDMDDDDYFGGVSYSYEEITEEEFEDYSTSYEVG